VANRITEKSYKCPDCGKRFLESELVNNRLPRHIRKSDTHESVFIRGERYDTTRTRPCRGARDEIK